MKNKEVEFKYKASVSIEEFKRFCVDKNPLDLLVIAGYDHFYSNLKDKDSFFRHRTSFKDNELTFKRKTALNNSFVRTEINIEIANGSDSIAELCKEMGYEYNTSVFKSCLVYTHKNYVVSYYICYDSNMKELDRFIEIEVREDRWDNEKEAWDELLVLEKVYKPLGISTSGRIKSSLFEMYRKE